MITKNSLLIGALLSFASNNLLASANLVQEIAQRNTDKSKYEVLKEAFEKSNDALELNDIASLGENCVIVTANKENEFFDHKLVVRYARKMVKNEIPAQPSKGPLFPAQPAVPAEYEVRPFVIRTITNLPLYIDVADFDFKMTIEPTLITKEVLYKDDSYAQVFSVKRDANILTFQIKERRYSESFITSYGYCWGK